MQASRLSLGIRWVAVRHAARLLLAVLAVSGCAPSSRRERAPMALAVRVEADTSSRTRLHIGRPAPARVWMTRVAPARGLEPPLPVPGPGALGPDSLEPSAPPGFGVAEGLKPPLLRSSAALQVPPGSARGRVELDVRVDESGTVTDALWAGGSRDSARTAAATRCAYSMRFYPALRAGRPVAVWCRQRFDFPGR